MEIIMHLDKEPFNKIKSGKKTIECRLNDEKRRNIKVGDTIKFGLSGKDKEITCEVTNLYSFNSFEELYNNIPKEKLGYDEDDIASPADMNVYYSSDRQLKYGVVGIEIKVIK